MTERPRTWPRGPTNDGPQKKQKSLGELLTFDIYVYIFVYTNGKPPGRAKGQIMKKKPFTYVIDCGEFYSFSSVLFAIREEVKHNAAILKIMKESSKIWNKERVIEQINKCRALFKVYKSVLKHWRETNPLTGLKG